MFTLSTAQADALITLLANVSDDDYHEITGEPAMPGVLDGLFDSLGDAFLAVTGHEHPDYIDADEVPAGDNAALEGAEWPRFADVEIGSIHDPAQFDLLDVLSELARRDAEVPGTTLVLIDPVTGDVARITASMLAQH